MFQWPNNQTEGHRMSFSTDNFQTKHKIISTFFPGQAWRSSQLAKRITGPKFDIKPRRIFQREPSDPVSEKGSGSEAFARASSMFTTSAGSSK